MANEIPRREAAAGRGTSARWISNGLEVLLHELGDRPVIQRGPPDFDVVIVGSGYGGALSALKLSGAHENGRQLRVCVLERGREYLAGMFPGSEGELPGHIRFNTPAAKRARGRMDALLDLRIGTDISALVANGLGGGSLINAGVMLQPTREVLQSECWPQNLRAPDVLQKYYGEAQVLLSANSQRFQTVAEAKVPTPQKFQTLQRLGGSAFQPVPLSIAIEPGVNNAGVRLEQCKRCGDCATGCNHRAKNSLDQNSLVLAKERGARIFTGATVLGLERMPDGDGWILYVGHTDSNLREQQGAAFPLMARRVILAAGTYGSTEILLRSRSDGLMFSARLGSRFSGNGDLLAAAYGQNERVNSVALETTAFEEREVGPSVTGMIDCRARDKVAIQEFSIPGPLRRLVAESFTTAYTFHSLGRSDWSRYGTPADGIDPCGVNPHTIDHTQILGLIGEDSAGGTLELVPDSDAGQGAIRVSWPKLREGPDGKIFTDEMHALEELVANSGQGGTVLPNPIWRILPQSLQSIIDIPRGPAITVHPLGGCAMGDDWSQGVVDSCGRVFDLKAPGGVHDDLIVLDGSIIPCALGINPSLTIAAVTLRSLEHLCAQWHIKPWTGQARLAIESPPVFRIPKVAATRPATIAVLERLSGKMDLKLESRRAKRYHVELTLDFQPAPLDQLAVNMERTLCVDESKSRLRIFRPDQWEELSRRGASEGQFDQRALFTAPLKGELTLLQRKTSSAPGRITRAVWAWLLNRGLRDTWQRYVSDRDESERRRRAAWGTARSSGFSSFLNIANHAGGVRLFDYNLEILPAEGQAASSICDRRLRGRKIRGIKELAYRVGSNPWKQLMEVILVKFPHQAWTAFGLRWGRAPRLELDGKFYADQGAHLMRLCSQRDHATGLFDIASFVLTAARAVLTTHFWSFRKPDHAPARRPQRLPGRVAGLPEPSIIELPLPGGKSAETVSIRLTRYGQSKARGKPIVLIHGFSASGTSFAHPALKPGLAKYLWDEGRDVWILDLRTSSGLPSCRDEWAFEEVACNDIPVALQFIHETTRKTVDVFAHCMGAAMFSMALLDKTCMPKQLDSQKRPVGAIVRSCIHRVVLSQIGPMIAFSPSNIFRAYVVSYIEHAIGNVTFRMQPEDGLGSHLLDRILSSVCYPEGEFRIENPRTPWKRTPFVGTRHRMDAWFGCVFKLSNVGREVLDHIDDLFGDINLRTTFQTIHFARTGIITTRDGRNEFLHRDNFDNWCDVPTLSIHGECNRLADPATLTRMHGLMRSINPGYRSFEAKGFGHQDCIIGTNAAKEIFPTIKAFLDGKAPQAAAPAPVTATVEGVTIPYIVRVPWIGPILGDGGAIAIGADPKLGKPRQILIVPVDRRADGGHRMRPNAAIVVRRPRPVAIHNHRTGMQAIMQDGVAMYSVACVPRNDDYLILLAYDEPSALGLNAFAAEPQKRAASAKQRSASVQQYLEQTLPTQTEPALLRRSRQKPDPDRLRFVLTSCQYPAGPLDPHLASASYEKLNDLLARPDTSPDFVILTGDQVYTDASAGLMDASQGDDRYRRPYEELLRTRAVRAVFGRVPVFTMLDDHEIEDNWNSFLDDVDVEAAKTAYLKFQRAAGPPCEVAREGEPDPLWYTTQQGGIHFFFADTRSERMGRTAQQLGEAQIMSKPQLDALKLWLISTSDRAEHPPLFVVSPSAVLPRRMTTVSTTNNTACALQSDAWDGYPKSLHDLLAYIVHHRIQNVIFLSGDEHHSFAASATLSKVDRQGQPLAGTEVAIHSIHSSGLYAPYTFANGCLEELAADDDFVFPSTDPTHRCRVHVDAAAAGNGFAEIECRREDSEWVVQCSFHKAESQRPEPLRHKLRLTPKHHCPQPNRYVVAELSSRCDTSSPCDVQEEEAEIGNAQDKKTTSDMFSVALNDSSLGVCSSTSSLATRTITSRTSPS